MKGIDATLVIVPVSTQLNKEDYSIISRVCDGCGELLSIYTYNDPEDDNHTLMDCLKTIQKKLNEATK